MSAIELSDVIRARSVQQLWRSATDSLFSLFPSILQTFCVVKTHLINYTVAMLDLRMIYCCPRDKVRRGRVQTTRELLISLTFPLHLFHWDFTLHLIVKQTSSICKSFRSVNIALWVGNLRKIERHFPRTQC